MMDTRLELRPIHTDVGDNLAAQRNRRNAVYRTTSGPPPERRSTISGMMPPIYESTTRMRNLSGGSSGSAASGSSSGSSLALDNPFPDNCTQVFFPLDMSALSPFSGTTSPSTVPSSRSGSMSHRKFDRSLSDSESDRLGPSSSSSQRSVNSSRYKTELCRPFEESGSCKYGDKCQFAHGMHELRNLARHPKYKTELCRTFHSSGFCPYGPRCHFIHADEGKGESSPKVSRQSRSGSYSGTSNTFPQSSSGSNSPSLSPSGSDTDYSIFNYQDNSNQFNNINNFCGHNNDIHALENQFNTLNLNNVDNVFGGHFSIGSSNNAPEEEDIFSKVTMFNSEEVDNGKAAYNSAYNLQQSAKLDNFPSFIDTNWPADRLWSHSLGAVQPETFHHHSPTGSMGSEGSVSDCSSSTESLASSSGCRDNTGYISPFSNNWISSF